MGDIKFGSLHLLEWTLDTDRNWRRYCSNYLISPDATVWLTHVGVDTWKPYFGYKLYFLNDVYAKSYGEYVISRSPEGAKTQIDFFLQKMDSLKIFT